MNKPKKLSAEEKEKQARIRKIAKMKRMMFPSEYPGEMIYVSEKHYVSITKKVNITNIQTVGGIGGKVIVNYEPKVGKGSGTLELFDIGPGQASHAL